MNRFSSRETLTGIEVHYEEVRTIDAVCINCNKRFTSMRGVTMHLKMTAARHVVNFINYGNYDKKTGLKTRLGQTLSLGILQKAPPKLGIHSSHQPLFDGLGGLLDHMV